MMNNTSTAVGSNINKQYVLRKESLLMKRFMPDYDLGNETALFSQKKQGSNWPCDISWVLNNAAGLVSWKDPDSRFMGCNEQWAKYARLKKAREIIGKDDSNFSWGADGYTEVFKEEDREVLSGTVSVTLGKYSYVDGKKIIITQKNPLTDKSGQVIIIVNYITEIKMPTLLNVTQTLAQMNIEMEPVLIDYLKKILLCNDDCINLTPREEECLYYLIRGLSAKEIGRKLDLSNRTVEFYIAAIKDKLNCRKTSALIAKAIGIGYFDNIPTGILLNKYGYGSKTASL
jgi:DNA-binding CsgD family transcriptional regulator